MRGANVALHNRHIWLDMDETKPYNVSLNPFRKGGVLKSDLPEPVRGLDLLDLFLVCWMVVAVAITADGLLGDSLGKARFFVVEVAIFLLACAYLRLRKQSLPELLRWNPVPWKVLPGIILAALGSALVLDGLDRLVQLVIPMPGEQIAH